MPSEGASAVTDEDAEPSPTDSAGEGTQPVLEATEQTQDEAPPGAEGEAAAAPEPQAEPEPEPEPDPQAEPEPGPEPQAEPPVALRRGAEVMVLDIAVDLPTPHALVTLREVDDPHRIMVIPVALPEATALAHAWRGVPTPRPLTHELFADVLVRLGATIDVVRLTGRRAGVVLAELELSSSRGAEVVPCRPTDALTLSVRQLVSAPILVDPRLFDADGDVEPEG